MELISQLLSIAAVLSLAAAAAWLLRRGRFFTIGQVGRGKGLIEVLDKRVVSPQLTIHVIRVRDTEFVLAANGVRITVLKREQR